MAKTMYWGLLIIIAVIASCAPVSIQSPISQPTTQAPTVAPIPAQAPKAEDNAWTKVVQAARKEGKVVSYSYNMVGDIGIALNKALQEKYGISLEVVSSTAQITVERIKTEYRTGQHAADMMDGSVRGTKLVVDEGFTVKLTDLPALKESGNIWLVPLDSWDPAGRNVITHLSFFTVFANTNQVKPEEYPKSWYDLLDPKWKGQIAAAHPSLSTSMDALGVILVGRDVLEKDYFTKLGKNELVFTSQGARGPAEALARGQTKLAISTDDSALPLVKAGAPIKALSLKEGVTGSAQGLSMLSKAPHPSATRVFINWLFSEEGAAVYAKARAGMSIRKSVSNYLPEAAKFSLEKIYTEKPEDADVIMDNYKKGVILKALQGK